MSDESATYETLRLTTANGAFRRSILQPRQLAIHPIGHDHEGSPVEVLRVDDLEAVLRSVPRGLVIDRGKKDRRKALATYLAGRSGLLAIRAHYGHAGQALRGVRALVETAARHKTRAAFFVGVEAAIFEALAQRAVSDAPHATPADDPAAQLNHLIGDSIAVPKSLRHTFLGDAPQMEWVRRCIVMASSIDHPVLIQGESGTGKEIIARQIHALSPRATERFMPVNCGAIPSELFESELFGHIRGSFSGAVRTKRGLWTVAEKGTLLLDEIGDLSPHHQVKILRAIETGAFLPVGGDRELVVRARVIAATNRDLGAMVQAGQFRDDLYFRLFNFRIRSPALREHPADIPLLARHFWRKLGEGTTPPLPAAVTEALMHHRWPGNARELRSFLVNLQLVARGRKVDVPLAHAVLRERLGGTAQTRRDT